MIPMRAPNANQILLDREKREQIKDIEPVIVRYMTPKSKNVKTLRGFASEADDDILTLVRVDNGKKVTIKYSDIVGIDAV